MPRPSVARTERSTGEPGSTKGVEGRRGGRPAIFHRFRVRANFNNIRSIRYSQPHIKSVRANEAPPARRNMMSGGRGDEERRKEDARGGGEAVRIEGGSDRRGGGGPRRAQNETCNKVSF